jgi:hypothetical protein
LAGWLPLADFHAHYFRFIEQTGGQSHLTFRTAEVEPKQAALQYILQQATRRTEFIPFNRQNDGLDIWIVCSQWWNRWPIRYLALPERGVRVPDPEEIAASADYRRALAEGRVWFVEFCGTDDLRQVELQLSGRAPERQQFLDYAHRPILCVLHAGTK